MTPPSVTICPKFTGYTKASLAFDCIMNQRPTFMWEYPNFNSQDLILKKERILRLQSASRPAVTIRRSYLSLYYFVLWPVMPTTANHSQPSASEPSGCSFRRGCSLATSGSSDPLQSSSFLCKCRWNQHGRCSLGAQH